MDSPAKPICTCKCMARLDLMIADCQCLCVVILISHAMSCESSGVWQEMSRLWQMYSMWDVRVCMYKDLLSFASACSLRFPLLTGKSHSQEPQIFQHSAQDLQRCRPFLSSPVHPVLSNLRCRTSRPHDLMHLVNAIWAMETWLNNSQG